MRPESLEFRCYGCRMILNMPIALEVMTLANLRKFFKFMDQEWQRNEESTRKFFSCIPEVQLDLKGEWDEASRTFQREYKDTKFDSSGNYISDKDERERRQAHNQKLLNDVKRAKSRYERFVKRVPKLKELKDQYQH